VAVWLCADLNVECVRDLLERIEQLKDRLKYLAVGRKNVEIPQPEVVYPGMEWNESLK
jgi:hypothetical protein